MFNNPIHIDHKILAAIDIGTNSFHLLVAEIIDRNRFKLLTREKEVVRLGTGSKDMKHITPESMERALKTLKRFKIICDNHKAIIRAVATSATREALNKDDFISRVFEETGIAIEVISGYEEARLIYLGVLQAIPVYKKRIMLIDIGGGSTEFLIGQSGNLEFGQSIKIGSVRLTNKFFLNGSFKPKQVDEARVFIKGAINPIVRSIKNEKVDMIIGTSGTIINIGQMIIENEPGINSDPDNMNNFSYSKEELNRIIKKFLKYNSASDLKKNIHGLDPKRVDIIIAGLLILEQIFQEFEIKKLTVSNYALREGIILDTIEKAIGSESLGHLSDVRFKSVMTLAGQTNFDKQHSLHVSKLALKIFDALKDRFGLTEHEREYLEAACVLHDIGYYISHSSHHKHSYYLIRNSEMLGFNFTEIEIIANVARYHRKSHPKPKHIPYNKLDELSKQSVRRLSGILRVADGLDRGHNTIVEDLDLRMNKNSFEIGLIVKDKENPVLEIWGANRRKKLFEEEFGVSVDIKQ